MKKLLMFILSFFLWIFFTGQLTIPIIILGAFVSIVISLLFGNMVFRFLTPEKHPGKIFYKLFYIILVIFTFIYDVYESAFKVAFHAFQFNPSFSPGIVRIKTKLTNITAITIMSNLITLTPGTLVLDFDVLERHYYIHWIDVKTKKEAEIKKEIIGRQEEWILNIFS